MIEKSRKKRILITVIILTALILFVAAFFWVKHHSTDNTVVKYSKDLYFKQVDGDRIATVPDMHLKYVTNELILDAEFDLEYKDVEALVKTYGADIVGYIKASNTYQIEVEPDTTYDKLIKLQESLEKETDITGVYLNKIYPVESLEGFYPNDKKWKNEWKKGAKGTNWGLSFIEAPEAWNYLKHSGNNTPITVNVGIFEVNGVDNSHEDLKDSFPDGLISSVTNTSSKEDVESHGTAVAGIIGAGFDNGIGLTGVIPKVKMRFVSWNGLPDAYAQGSSCEVASMVLKTAMTCLIEKKDKQKTAIINASLGLEDTVFAASRGDEESIKILEDLNSELGILLHRLLIRGYDFLICKGAGNNNAVKDEHRRYQYLYVGEDDENAVGGYVKLTKSNIKQYKKLKDFKSRLDYGNVDAKYDIFSGITDADVKDRIIVVGSIGENGRNYAASEFGCTGERVDILAPGDNIYTLKSNNKYSKKGEWGTSYSAPYVSGVAGLALSVNPSLSGNELKKLLIDSGTGKYVSVLNNQTFEYKALNANNAVRYADKDVITQEQGYKWDVHPTVEADDIYYLNSDDALANPVNKLKKPLENNYGYAVIQKENRYGLINMKGMLLDGLEFEKVDTMVSTYHVTYAQPRYEASLGIETKEFNLYEDGLEPAFGHGDSYGLCGGIYYWNNGLQQIDFTNTMPEPKEPIPVQNISQIADESLRHNSRQSIQWYKEHTGKYAVYSNGELVTDFIFDECGSYSDGLMAVCKDEKWGYVDENGKIVIPIEYDTTWNQYVPYEDHEKAVTKPFCYAASDGYVILRKEDEWEVQDIQGNQVIWPGEFEAIRPVYDGKCWVKKDGKWGVVQLQSDEKNEQTNNIGKGMKSGTGKVLEISNR